MRLHTLLALTTVGVGYAALTACDGEEKPSEEADTDTDTDADTDADTDVDSTGNTGEDPPPDGYFAYVGDANYDIATSTYTGDENVGFYLFNDVANPAIDDVSELCVFTFGLTNPTPAPTTPCTGCTWTAQVTFGPGTESTPAGECEAIGVTTPELEGESFGYGFHPEYDYQGTLTPSLMFYSAADDLWVSPADATYDEATGAFTYVWLDGFFTL